VVPTHRGGEVGVDATIESETVVERDRRSERREQREHESRDSDREQRAGDRLVRHCAIAETKDRLAE